MKEKELLDEVKRNPEGQMTKWASKRQKRQHKQCNYGMISIYTAVEMGK